MSESERVDNKKPVRVVQFRESSLVIILPALVLLAVLITFLIINNSGTGKDINSLISHEVFKTRATMYHNSNDWVVRNITEQCVDVDSVNQPFCVMELFVPFYNYAPHNDSLRTPSEYYEHGGVCGDTALLHSSIFRVLGWDVQFMFPTKNHVYTVISKQIPCVGSERKCYMFCDLDGKEYVCKIIQ